MAATCASLRVEFWCTKLRLFAVWGSWWDSWASFAKSGEAGVCSHPAGNSRWTVESRCSNGNLVWLQNNNTQVYCTGMLSNAVPPTLIHSFIMRIFIASIQETYSEMIQAHPLL